MLKPFLTANWRYLVMLNFAVDPKILEPLVPVQTELDFHGGQTFLSVVGFLFLDTRVIGLPIPLHREPLFSPRPDLIEKYPTHADQKVRWAAQHFPGAPAA